MPDKKEKEIEEALATHLGYTIGDRFVVRFSEADHASHEKYLLGFLVKTKELTTDDVEPEIVIGAWDRVSEGDPNA